MKINLQQYKALKDLDYLNISKNLIEQLLSYSVEGLSYASENTAFTETGEEVYISANTTLALILQNKF